MEEKKCPCDSLIRAQWEIDDHDKRLGQGDINMGKIDVRLENIEKTLDELKKNIEDIKGQPARKWEGLVNTITMLFVGAIFAMVLTTIGIQ